MRTLNKQVAAVAAGAIVVASAGAAYAYWTTTGSGSGSATAATTAGTLSLDGANVSGLVPGSAIDVPVTASNASTTTSLQASDLVLGTVSSSNKPGCLTLAEGARPVFAAVDPSAAVLVAPGGSESFGKVTVTLPNSTGVDQEACKGAVFSFLLTAQ